METKGKLPILFAIVWAVFPIASLCAGDAAARTVSAPQARLDISAAISPIYDSEIVIAQTFESAPRPSDRYRGGLPSVEVPREYVPSDPDVMYIAQKYTLVQVRDLRDRWYLEFRNTQSRSALVRYKKFEQALKYKQDKCIEQDRIRRTTDRRYQSVYCK